MLRLLKHALIDPRDEAAVRVDCRFLPSEERTESTWVRRSAESALADRLIWVAGESETVEQLSRELHRSRAMVSKYEPRRESLSGARKLLLQQEKNRIEDIEKRVREAIAEAWMAGRLYFRGRALSPRDQGGSFGVAVNGAATLILPELYPHFIATQILSAELMPLIAAELAGPSPKFMPGELGILELDSGRYVPACSGVVPRRVQERIESEGGLAGASLLACFGGPPYGYTVNVVKACIAGLLRAGKVCIQPEGGNEITAIRDAGVRDLFEKDRAFRRATCFPAGEDDIGFRARARICKFFEERLQHPMEREDHAIAAAVGQYFPSLAQQQRAVLTSLDRLPGERRGPDLLRRLGEALDQCVSVCRQTKPTVKLVKRFLDVLSDGVQQLQMLAAELTPEAIQAVRTLHQGLTVQAAQLSEIGNLTPKIETVMARLTEQLAAERPWCDIAALEPDLETIRSAYRAERERLLQWQEEQAEQARAGIRSRPGFSTLTADQSHRVLRPLTRVLTDTTGDAVAPTLSQLHDPFILALQRAEEEVNDTLYEILSEGAQPLVKRVDLRLRNRELTSEAEVEALVSEIREQLLEQLRAGARVRLL
jgi:hypothetical protein